MHAARASLLQDYCSVAAGTGTASSAVVYSMAQEPHEAPVGRSRSRSSSSTSPATTGMWWESPRQMQAHTPFPSWIPYAAGTFAAGAGLAAAADPSLPSQHFPDPDHAWNQSASSMGAHGGSSGYRGNFLSLLEAKNVTPEMFEDVPAAACDYLGVGGMDAAASSNMAAGPAADAYGLLGSSVDPYSPVATASSAPPVKHETASSVLHGASSMGCMPCYDHEEKPPADDSQRLQGFGAPKAAFLQQMIPRRVVEIRSALGYSGMVSERLESSFGVESFPDAGSVSDYDSNRSSADFMINRSSADFMINRSSADFTSSNSNRQEQDIRAGMGGSSSRSGASTSVTTRRKSEEGVVGGNTKKSKQGASHKTSPPKPPQVKLGEKITALQQIVSPFGKTDTSSVLFETIEYIKFLHEQIRLFSEPYMTKSTYKGHIRRRGEEKEESGTGHGLRGRGLCLVPVALTSQAYHDDTLPDCWAPAYRSCLYP